MYDVILLVFTLSIDLMSFSRLDDAYTKLRKSDMYAHPDLTSRGRDAEQIDLGHHAQACSKTRTTKTSSFQI